MTFSIRSKLASDRMGCTVSGRSVLAAEGFQCRRRSFAKQCGRRGEGEGVRPERYGRGFEDACAGGSTGGETNLGESA